MWQSVELREIRTFLTVADELNFTRAAGRLGITHSRVSQTICALEAHVGGRLFDRTSRRVTLTPLGERLRAGIQSSYQQMARAFNETRDAAVSAAGLLRIGTYTPVNYGPHWLEVVRTFEARNPGCVVQTIDLGPERNVLDRLRDGEAHLLAMRLPISALDMSIGPILSREERVLAVSTRDPLAQRDSVCLDDLADRVVSDTGVVPRETMEAFIPPVTPSGRRLRRLVNRSVFEAVMRVAMGELVHPTVASFLEYHPHHGVVCVPFRDLPPSETALVWQTASRSPEIDAFVHVAVDVLAHTSLGPHPEGAR